MSSELVQTGFFDIESVASNATNGITIVADWNGLSEEEVELEASKYHDELDRREQQLKAIKSFVEEQEKNVTYEKGELYRYMKATKTYEKWVEWLKSKNVAVNTANQNIMFSTEYRSELAVTSGNSRLLSRNQLRAIHRTGEGHEILAKVNSGDIKPTWEALNKEIEAAKQRAKEAEEKLEEERRQHSLFKQEVETSEQAHIALVQSLEQKIEEKPEPEKVIEYQDTLETAAKVATLEAQIKALEDKPDITPKKQQELDKLQLNLKNAQTELDFYTTQNKAIAEELKKHQEESGRTFEEITSLAGQLRIRQVWQYATTEIQASIRKFHTQIPSEIDRQSFEGEEHTRTAQTIEILEQTIAMLKKTLLGSDSTVNAEIVPMLTVLGLPETIDSIVIGIPPEYQPLFNEYEQKLLSSSRDSEEWVTNVEGYIRSEKPVERHIQYTRELLSSRVDRRIRAALSAMKIVLGREEACYA